ncbi:aminoglycoside 3-N-acetyltransferase [Martelella mediterranea]|uniref:Aminoglycoside N(3)-acetyltransferase n=1 Tax=Martelella mediterranea DSM 17316 TaxID=1122214 RepID=A0A1U9Z869_9HYPH|nr:aminoglycoside 3-N-acetyltransferase [Martelella mediterranea]AQZ53878.1 SPBc2 prophage-derived aminoglycoside N(3')-acetyltransferase-like protein YokD [Martelella mediterranea DSM 17316]
MKIAPIPATPNEIAQQLADLGVRSGDLLMVHASLKAVGPVLSGAGGLLQGLLSAIGPGGTVMGYAAWDRSPYEETLNGATLSEEERSNWPAFDPANANVYPGFGMFNAVLASQPGAKRSAHPDSSMVAIGPLAETLVSPHALGDAFGPRSPVDRFIALRGKVLLLGAPLDAVTVLHYAEAVADIPGKRRVRYEMPLLDADGHKVWQKTEEWDSNGILDCYAIEGEPDAVERITRDYVATRKPARGKVGNADCYLFAARDIVNFGIEWLERRHGASAR